MEKTSFDQPDASAFVDRALSRIPSTFGEICFLASLRRRSSERYEDPLAGLVYGKDRIAAVLREKHLELYRAWLCKPLATQTKEVSEYLSEEAEAYKPAIAQTLRQWVHENVCEGLIPSAVSPPERELFLCDLKIILQLLQTRSGF